ncbi:extracellular solute-binding protein [Paenibacillus barcinonensis]|uniref:Extracellular solute-binding protein n=1 Tax=Paenibacillus barcinonensis TaxID=198119 RepID=A0A2V4V6W9_PAEBA|nr:extracellular solute-binding protein [Paenibacillus barcinonensis]PYE48083.1 putative aldouronate transport system substrate-binding protein [Paenibacillus barcinonensis]QKS55192.1 extracellular solute-binding protein [Paenibacillus barcinonensis]
MNKKVKLLVLSMSICALLVTACSDAGKKTPTDAEHDGTGAVTIHTVTSEYSSAKYPKGDDITNNVWTRRYKEKLNINVKTDWVSDEYETKLNLAISSNELPDVFRVNPSQLRQLVEADMVMDLTEAFEQHASERLKSYMKADADSYESGKKDGKLYGIPQMHWGLIDQPDFIWIRNDWKEELGLQDPSSVEDIKNIALKFMEKHGGYGIAVDQSLDYLNLLAIAWNAHPDMWIDDGTGKLTYGSIQPEMKAALAEWADWYKRGIIDPEFAIKDFNAMNADIVAGKVGVQPYYQWWGYNPGVDTVANLGKDAIFYPYLIPTVDGKEAKQSIFFANNNYIVMKKDAANPKAVIEILNDYAYIVDEGNGKETQDTLSALLDNDIAHVVGAFRVLNPNSDYEQYEAVSKALETEDTSGLTTSGMWQKYNNSVEFKKNATPGSVGDYLQQGAPKNAYGLAKKVLDSENYIKTALWGVSPEALSSYGTTLDDILTEGFTKIIMGSESIDYFDVVVQNWRAAGGDTAIEAVNEAYGK